MSTFVLIETGAPGPSPEEWLATLPEGAEKTSLLQVWADHQARVTAAGGGTPGGTDVVPLTPEVEALVEKFKTTCGVRDSRG